MPVVNLPTPSGAYSPSLLAQLFRAISLAFGRCMPTDEAVESFILRAPNGGRWKVTISNAGVVTTSAV